nr:Chain U, CdnA3 Leader peptide [Chryseobacterium gregarium DSM 19109]7MGV_V Chain V, CdnA3 Leader peptide [Chryseobacterium gregarium DSM 19109]
KEPFFAAFLEKQ